MRVAVFRYKWFILHYFPLLVYNLTIDFEEKNYRKPWKMKLNTPNNSGSQSSKKQYVIFTNVSVSSYLMHLVSSAFFESVVLVKLYQSIPQHNRRIAKTIISVQLFMLKGTRDSVTVVM